MLIGWFMWNFEDAEYVKWCVGVKINTYLLAGLLLEEFHFTPLLW